MADVIGLINDISPSVKLAWVVALAWTAVQIVWYRRGRVLPGEAASFASRWSSRRQVSSVTRLFENDPIEVPRSRETWPESADAATVVDADADAEIAFGFDELVEFQEAGTPRRRSNRRRRSTVDGTSAAGVADLALDTPKVT